MTKLQKLLYIVYGYYLSNKEGHRIIDEHPQAWPYGPVFPKVHRKVDYTKVTPLDDPMFDELNKDEELKNILNKVVDIYAQYSATQLSGWSHMDGGPWKKTTVEDGFKWSGEISDDYIKEYFKGKKVM